MPSFLWAARFALGLSLAIPSAQAIMQDKVDIEVTKAMECERKTRNGDRIKVHYAGTLTSGVPFDSSYNRNQPFSFTLGQGEVIKGWDMGLLDMCPGEERRLTIPPSLAYGERPVGSIPAGSTLIFDTLLVDIFELAISPNPPPASIPIPDEVDTDYAQSEEEEVEPVEEEPEVADEEEDIPAETTTADPTASFESENGECRLLGSFALFVQGGLGILAILSLVWKRYYEHPRRPLLVWFFDVSKQVFGSVLLHMANLLMSMLPFGAADGGYSADLMHAPMPNDRGQVPNPCSYYLINLAIDTTIGIVILVVVLRILNHGLSYIAVPPESIKSGNYGRPPKWKWWLKQALIYFVALFIMKLCVFFIFTILPWIAWVGDWALRWTYGNTALQITFVMFVFPLCMNALQYYIIDAYIKDPASGEEIGTGEVDDDENDEDDEREPLHGDDLDEEALHGQHGPKIDGQRVRTREVLHKAYDSLDEEGSQPGESIGSSTDNDVK